MDQPPPNSSKRSQRTSTPFKKGEGGRGHKKEKTQCKHPWTLVHCTIKFANPLSSSLDPPTYPGSKVSRKCPFFSKPLRVARACNKVKKNATAAKAPHISPTNMWVANPTLPFPIFLAMVGATGLQAMVDTTGLQVPLCTAPHTPPVPPLC